MNNYVFYRETDNSSQCIYFVLEGEVEISRKVSKEDENKPHRKCINDLNIYNRKKDFKSNKREVLSVKGACTFFGDYEFIHKR